MKLKRKMAAFLLSGVILGTSVTGCQTKEKEKETVSEPAVTQYGQEPASEGDAIDKVHRDRELFILEDESMCFSLGGETIKVKDKEGMANALTSVEWINSEMLAVTCHVNPSLNYFTVYDVQKKEFDYGTYGYDFIWKDGDINTLVYIQAPAHFSKKGGTYYIRNYDGKEVYHSKEELSGLGFDENGDIVIEIVNEDGTVLEKEIENLSD